MGGGSAITRQLLRVSRRTHLPGLKQGTTLSVRTSLPRIDVKLRIQSGWRDDGGVTLVQTFQSSSIGHNGEDEASVAMLIQQKEDKMTSLGRAESHLGIELMHLTTNPQQLVPLGHHDEQNPVILLPDDRTEVKAWWITSTNDDNYAPNVELTLDVPEKINLVCEILGEGGCIDVTNKIEGDVKLRTTKGSVRVKQLRGHTVDLETASEGSHIHASDLLEAQQLKLTLLNGGRLRAKRIHGDKVDINVSAAAGADGQDDSQPSFSTKLDDDDEGSFIDISSMFVSGTGGAHITLEGGLVPPKQRGVRIKSHHGPVVVNTTATFQRPRDRLKPLVELGSVNGSCEVIIDQQQPPGTKKNQEQQQDNDWPACQVHFDSISPASVSVIQVSSGNIVLTFDRKMEADLRLVSTSHGESLAETVNVLAEEGDPNEIMKVIAASPNTNQTALKIPTRISIKTPSFTTSQSYASSDNNTEYMEGFVENKSNEPDSRFEMKTRSDLGLGKIRLDGAAKQALNYFSPSSEGPSVNAGATGGPTRPLIVAATSGNVSVETLSWLGAIARRYGLDEKGRDLGRQATRRGRVVLPADE